MYRLYIGHSPDDKKLLCEYATEVECRRKKVAYLKEKNFTYYYARIWKRPDGLEVEDFGSHVWFFFVEHVKDGDE